MTTVAQAIRETRELLGGDRDVRNRLVLDHSEGTTTLRFEFPLAGVQAGSKVEIGDRELCHVWSVDADNKTATVDRGQFGSDAEEWPAGTVVRVSPGFTTQRIREALSQELDALLGEGLFRAVSRPVTFSRDAGSYDIRPFASEVLSVVSLEMEYQGRKWPVEYVRRGERLYPWVAPPVDTATLVYRAGFQPFQQDDDSLVAACGLPDSARDIPAIGAALRLLTAKEAQRLDIDSQSHIRKSEDVPPLSYARQAGQLRIWREQRIASELMRLRERYPVKVAR